jgi:hypothetical protein
LRAFRRWRSYPRPKNYQRMAQISLCHELILFLTTPCQSSSDRVMTQAFVEENDTKAEGE